MTGVSPELARGEANFPTRRIALPDEVDVRRIRTTAGMSRAEFARAFCMNPGTLREWERGRGKPDATARPYLAVIAKNRAFAANMGDSAASILGNYLLG